MSFNAKILLFGEYAVLYQSDALLIPFEKFSGKLDFIDKHSNNLQQQIQSNKLLHQLSLYLEKAKMDSRLFYSFNLTQLKTDIKHGLFFNSKIPEGYGIGSSGALVAAIFSKYSEKRQKGAVKDQWIILKDQLALIESFFHGKSSGLDPLVSFLDQRLLVQGNNIQPVNPDLSSFYPFLIDTSKTRTTQEYVQLFRHKCKMPTYEKNIKTRLLDLNNRCIHSLLQGDHPTFCSTLKQLSLFQYEAFEEMIIPEFKSIWKQGIDSDTYYLKLCGAGGGGYLLGFSRNKSQLDQLHKDTSLTIIRL
ncbi:MAG: mevalonate kinase [Bacteroidales bacterium]|nr:mevalonate kinase [Bacteroidales bacterium]